MNIYIYIYIYIYRGGGRERERERKRERGEREREREYYRLCSELRKVVTPIIECNWTLAHLSSEATVSRKNIMLVCGICQLLC